MDAQQILTAAAAESSDSEYEILVGQLTRLYMGPEPLSAVDRAGLSSRHRAAYGRARAKLPARSTPRRVETW